MDAHDLDVGLRAGGVDPGNYRIHGVEPGGRAGDGVYLLGPIDAGGWSIRTWERGREWPVREFPTEDAACRWFYDLMVNEKLAD